MHNALNKRGHTIEPSLVPVEILGKGALNSFKEVHPYFAGATSTSILYFNFLTLFFVVYCDYVLEFFLLNLLMAWPLRVGYAGAVYHIMARGDGGKSLFIDEEDHLLFLHWLSRVCKSHGWRVHAWVIMRNHFHLLPETPEPNLVSGMSILLGSFAQAWNRHYKRRGHVFQGRYKSIPVAGESAADAYQFQVVADYIHLNPARAGIAQYDAELKSSILDYEWSSLAAYKSGKRPKWLVYDRVLSAFELAKNGRGIRVYVEYIEKRSADERGELSDEAMAALRKGWYLGDDTFRDKLLAMVKGGAKHLKSQGSHDAGGS